MPSPQHTLLCSYRYDPLDRLISHSQLHMQMRQRFYCKSRLATEIQGAIGHSIFQHDNLLLAQQQRQDAALDTTLLATDLQRSVLHTLKHNHQRQSIVHSPYGHRPAESGLSSLLGFNGERPDPVTGHYLLGNGYRAFNPVLMRFNSPDSWSPFGNGGLNPYAYGAGDPINHIDPTGHAFRGARLTGQTPRGALFRPKDYSKLQAKEGVTAEQKAHQIFKLQSIDTEINNTEILSQMKTFEKDKAIVLAAQASNPSTPSLGDRVTFDKLRPSLPTIFDEPKNISRRFPEHNSATIENLVRYEQSSYAPLFKELDSMRSGSIRNNLGSPAFDVFDQNLVVSYKARLNLTVYQANSFLNNKSATIRGKHFE
jgi:RHS repeat-associated protein